MKKRHLRMIPGLNRLLFATDFSECAMEAEEYDGVLATAYRASVDVFHVLELYPGLDLEYPINQIYLDQLRRDTDTKLAGAVRRFQGKRMKATGQHVLGVPSLQIRAAAVESQAGLIVMGTRGKMRFEQCFWEARQNESSLGRRVPCSRYAGPDHP
jgi:nucleotide-binding universal stress UspA family protein